MEDATAYLTPDDLALASCRERALRFLDRWRDLPTQSVREDLAQEAVTEAWRRRATLRCSERLDSYACTIARRRRWLMLQGWHRRAPECVGEEFHDAVASRPARPAEVRIAGRSVPMSWLLAELDVVWQELTPLNSRIIRSYYEGFSCAELAERYALSEDSVKVRLYRTRRRIRGWFEERVRAFPGSLFEE